MGVCDRPDVWQKIGDQQNQISQRITMIPGYKKTAQDRTEAEKLPIQRPKSASSAPQERNAPAEKKHGVHRLHGGQTSNNRPSRSSLVKNGVVGIGMSGAMLTARGIWFSSKNLRTCLKVEGCHCQNQNIIKATTGMPWDWASFDKFGVIGFSGKVFVDIVQFTL